MFDLFTQIFSVLFDLQLRKTIAHNVIDDVELRCLDESKLFNLSERQSNEID